MREILSSIWGSAMGRAVLGSLGLHLLALLTGLILLRPRFTIPPPLDAIPVDFIAMAAPEPAITERQEPRPAAPPQVVPDPLKPKPEKKPPRPVEKPPPPKPVEKPKPTPELPKVGSRDSTEVLKSELPKVGDMRGAMQMRVEGEALPYAYYLAIIQRKIASFWEPPAGIDQNAAEVACVVRFRIERDGSVATSHVEEPSGTSFFDTSALRALERARPLPPLPEEYPGQYLVIHLRFVYAR